ncbi:alpha/beta hydrolase family protein [Kribbella antibiotica]|nr:hypothetical protein [Kribbella antibiotica]
MITVSRRTVLAAAAAGLTATAVPAAAAAPAPTRLVLPRPTGPYPIGTTELRLVDESRADPWEPGHRRELMVSVWYPARPGAAGPHARYAPPHMAPQLADELGSYFGIPPGRIDYAGTTTHARLGVPSYGRHPVIVYSPGFGTSRLVSTNQVEDLASHGHVVVTIDHTGEAPVEFPGGRVTPVLLPDNDLHKPVAIRVADLKFVLDSLGRLALHRAMDLRRIGLLGYSLGGFAAAETMLTDHRIAAGVNLDGTMQYGYPEGELSEVAKRGLDRPFLLFGAAGHSHLPGGSAPDPSWTSFWANQRGWKLNLSLPAGTHGAFADYQFSAPAVAQANNIPPEAVTALLGTVNPIRSIKAQRAYVLAYFTQFLDNRPQPLLRQQSALYPEIKFV